MFGYFALSVAAAAMGNARGAIGDFAELAKVKVGQGSARTLAERSTTHAALAEAEASLRGAEALFDNAVEAAWAAAQGDAPVPVELRNGLGSPQPTPRGPAPPSPARCSISRAAP